MPSALGAPPGVDVYFASPEDIVLRKLEWYRKSNGALERQLRDVAGVLKVQGASLDVTYMRRIAGECDLLSLLERCLSEAGLA